VALAALNEENADQAAYWNGPSGTKWVDYQAQLDRNLDPLGQMAMDAVSSLAGKSVIDIGCGAGSTSLMLADRVGANGSVLGLDLSEPMLARAKIRAEGRANVSFIACDASAYDFGAVAADQLFSRFGVMFFRDPARAFTNLRRGLKPGGHLAFVCWRPMRLNAWMNEPLQAALTILPAPPPADPYEPGPYAFADDQRVAKILTEAGFADIDLSPRDHAMTIGPHGNSEADYDSAIDFAINFGPLSRMLGDVDAAMRARIRGAIGERLSTYRTEKGVVLPAAVWVVTARNPL
jgi:SAM-dependent methyltransferase